MDQFQDIWYYPLVKIAGVEITVSQVAMAILILVGGIIIGRWFQRALAKRLKASKIDPNSQLTIQRVVFYFILLLVFLAALAMLSIPITALAFISGAVAIGVGFGAQNIINNLISGWILMSERPVRIGDFIEIDEHKGVVESIGNRSTLIRRVDGVHMLVPNSHMLERMVINWTLHDKRIRTTVRVGVAYGSPVEQVCELFKQAVEEQEFTLKDPPVLVVFEDFGDNSLIFDAYFWADVAGERELRAIRSDIRMRVTHLFNENDIVIAFPQRDIHFDTGKPLEIQLSNKE
ncbi:MAG TPA: mechanosensitive ion channel domain-containing protein [Xanthomonadales bacterium]|nr:mechanosensitive ion channel domain-containing protein [Xanthomonadales bacterium]